MSWLRLNDLAATDPKIVGLTDAAFRLWIEGLSYCSRHLTDGAIVGGALRSFVASPAAAAELVDAGLWVETADGFSIPTYLDYQVSREKVLGERESDRRRKQSKRNPGDVRSESERNPGGVRETSGRNPSATYTSPTNDTPIVSGNYNRGYPQPDDDEQIRIRTAARIIAVRRAETRIRSLTSPEGWIATAARRLESGEHRDLLDIAEKHPDATAAELADLVQPLPATRKTTERPDCPDCNGTGWRWPDPGAEHVEPCDHQTPSTMSSSAA